MRVCVPRSTFRADGVRGVADRDLDDAFVRALGGAFGTLATARLGRRSRLAVARDCRVSSVRIHAALVRGLTEVGVAVVDLGVGPTPAWYFGMRHVGADGGAMITGGASPGDENGLRLLLERAVLGGDDLLGLADAIEAGRVTLAGGGSVESANVTTPYLDTLGSRVETAVRPVHVVLDAGNGSAGPLALEALRRAAARVTTLYCDMDGRFPHHPPDPARVENLGDAIVTVRREGADFGVVLDGDGVDLAVIDADGVVVSEAELRALFANPDAARRGGLSPAQSPDDVTKQGAIYAAQSLAEIVGSSPKSLRDWLRGERAVRP